LNSQRILGGSLFVIFGLGWAGSTLATLPSAKNPENGCGAMGILNQLKIHRVTKSDTLDAIASKYKLTTATIMAFNPSTREGFVQPGQSLKIPPINGLSHRLGNEETYKTIAAKFSVRADVLFERNGCEQKPEVVFVPGAVWRQELKLPNLLASARNFPRYDQNSAIAATQILPPVFFASGGYPLPYSVPVTSGYGWRVNPVTGENSFHSGIDLGASQGTPVLATRAGIVEFASWGGGYGNLIEMSHDRYGTRYAHLSEIQVRAGQRVLQGQQIGLVGSTGRSTGPHLHFELLSPSADGWVSVNPAGYLNRFAALSSWLAMF
jgi:murein DD-endopeptidase MepM/ murein hydrolase activator NlpD